MSKNELQSLAKREARSVLRANDQAERQADYLGALVSSVANTLHGSRAANVTSRLLAFRLRAPRFANLRNRERVQPALEEWINGNVHSVEDESRTSAQWRKLRREEVDATVRQAFRLAGMSDVGWEHFWKPLEARRKAAEAARPRLKILSAKQYAKRIMSNLQMLGFLSRSPAKHVAFETIKVALRVLVGDDGAAAAADYPQELSQYLRRGQTRNLLASLRKLVELVDRRIPWVRKFGARGAINEASGLCQNIKSTFAMTSGKPFEALRADHCLDALQALLLPNRRAGKLLDARGVAARIVVSAGAANKLWPERARRLEPDRDYVLRQINKALKT